MNQRQSRPHPMKTRMALVVVGLALGFTARWIGGILNDQDQQPLFKEMPDVESVADQTPDKKTPGEKG